MHRLQIDLHLKNILNRVSSPFRRSLNPLLYVLGHLCSLHTLILHIIQG